MSSYIAKNRRKRDNETSKIDIENVTKLYDDLSSQDENISDDDFAF